MKNPSKQTQESINCIIKGLFYLSREAENSQLGSVRNVILRSISDITGWIDNNEDTLGTSSTKIIMDTSFLAAIEFISKFASIKDEQLRNEILEELRIHDEKVTCSAEIFPFKCNKK